MKVAVIGGGINGIMTAWELARRGCGVDLFEKDRLMSATSRASTKMLHGGLRYLEHGHFGLVREALRERSWWLAQAPELTRPLEILLPIHSGQGRPRWQVAAGIGLYDLLATGTGFRKGRWYTGNEVRDRLPMLESHGLRGAYSYWDGQMDDYRLGLWAAGQAATAGVHIHEGSPVRQVEPESGAIALDGGRISFDRVVNVAGPWAGELIAGSAVASRYRLDLVRGSHLLLKGSIACGCILQVPRERRILFVLPYQGDILLGTTEVRQQNPDRPVPEQSEIDYLLATYNRFFADHRTAADIVDTFAGVRPIVASNDDISAASRDSVIERRQRLVNVFGGKWTTSRSLAIAVADITLQ
ncbi:MAG: glycerol-3-phosphate dehydrogenase/oxidase [Candidatus Accumulibacter sp.]|uniref:glycerol-3-phosphate dehydrogenase/oxidase n=1 Tax=Accumulibacter sp. TaxID=2053492 RepID=UPI001A3B7157|nr:glycerol-3-phosphate dehydrogenase/oxidase [Accumulibacter sp.]MBL8392783.1 glycerol-3-phosphate dehydrogenase/oxidase [Accumulibacter sp.]HRD88171.1 glycerol-3-phosphate dehydrogenase/oxidase [Accumulibacter sp.]